MLKESSSRFSSWFKKKNQEIEKSDNKSSLVTDHKGFVTAQVSDQRLSEGFLYRLKFSLLKTRLRIGSGFKEFFHGQKVDDALFEKIEERLLMADLGVVTTEKIMRKLMIDINLREEKDIETVHSRLKQEMQGILDKVDCPLKITPKNPYIVLIVGVNGVGKTTTIGKLANLFKKEGKSVMLAAGDTFRAAAVEQLQILGKKNCIPVIAQRTGADSASVIYDAIESARAKKVDVLIADTAGRLQNKIGLMDELKKIVRVIKKHDVFAPHEIALIIDSGNGQNVINQVKLFHEAVGLTGLIITKLDGTAKGGVIFSIADQFGIPIRYIGIGESMDDLRPFRSVDFVEALFCD